MHDDLSAWVEVESADPANSNPWLCLHFTVLSGRVEVGGLSLWTVAPPAALGGYGLADAQQSLGQHPRGLSAAADVRAVKPEAHTAAALERYPELRAELEARGAVGAISRRRKYDRRYYERVASVYARA